MSKIIGIVLIFAAAWLMVHLQAGSGACGGGSDRGPGAQHSDNCHTGNRKPREVENDASKDAGDDDKQVLRYDN